MIWYQIFSQQQVTKSSKPAQHDSRYCLEHVIAREAKGNTATRNSFEVRLSGQGRSIAHIHHHVFKVRHVVIINKVLDRGRNRTHKILIKSLRHPIPLT